MSKFWSKRINGISPYTAGEQPQDQSYVKLNTNENPYPPSPKVIERIKQLTSEQMRLYPDPEAVELKNVIANYYGLKTRNIFLGNGSDEVLAHTFKAFFEQDEAILFPDISYSFYPVYCGHFGIKYKCLSLTEKMDISIEQYPETSGGIIFPNPNAPTGKFLDIKKIEALLQRHCNAVVVIDEAYVDFGGVSCIPLITKYPNLLVVQTLSKSRSLAGLRVGFAIGDANLIDGLNRVKNSFNSYPLGRLAIGGAVAAFEDEQYFQSNCQKIIDTRQWTSDQLKSLSIEVLSSKANFLLVKHNEIDAKTVYKQLKNIGVLVRYFSAPRINEYVRVTIGTKEEMVEFIDGIKKITNS